jgi:hypothetical protein
VRERRVYSGSLRPPLQRQTHPFWLSSFCRASRLTLPSCHLMLVESPTWYAVVPSVVAAAAAPADEPTQRAPVAAGAIPVQR